MSNERKLYVQKGSVLANEVVLSGNVTIGSSGAITAQTGALASGFTVTKDVTSSAVGRYLATFDRQYSGLKSKTVSMDGPAAGTAFPTTTGIDPQFRSYATPGLTVSVQFTRSDTKADADPASGTVFYLTFTLNR